MVIDDCAAQEVLDDDNNRDYDDAMTMIMLAMRLYYVTEQPSFLPQTKLLLLISFYLTMKILML